MLPNYWVLIAFVGIVIFGLWHWKRGNKQINELKGSGFTVNVDLNGAPQLLLDEQDKSLAVVKSESFDVFKLSDIAKAELVDDKKAQVNSNYRVAIYLAGQDEPVARIRYESEWIAQDRLKTLQSYL